MGTMRRPNEFSSSDVNVQTMVGPIGTMVATNGTFLPYDSLLVDQLALISVATKYRLRELLEDAARLAKGPADWISRCHSRELGRCCSGE